MRKMDTKGQVTWIALGTIVFIVVMWIFWAFQVVEYNEYAFEVEFGRLSSEMKGQGINYIGIGTLHRVNNQIRNHEITVEASSKDLQTVKITLNVNMQLKNDKAYEFVKNYASEETYTQYLNNKMQENIKIAVLKYNVLDFVNNRSEVSKDIKTDVQAIPELNYFDIKDISIVNIKYSDELEAVLEKKGQVLIEREVIMRQKENIELINENMKLTNMSDYFKYRIAEKWDGKSPLTIVGGN
jgi:regulator of protease activity HflC (stomatin/prohibitin superfamily)